MVGDAALERWDRRVRIPIVAAAVAPLVLPLLGLGDRFGVLLTVDLLSWTVFAVDLVVRLRLVHRYLRSGMGMFDAAIVVLTFPWYVFPSVGNTAFLAVFRLARLLRLVTVTKLGKRLRYLTARLGPLLAILVGSTLVSSVILLRSEPVDGGFHTFADTIWWSIVTFTTVGYGDLTPTTPTGRLAGVLMMFVGLATLGTVAGALASMFGGEDEDELLKENHRAIEELRAEVERLTAAVERLSGGGE